MDIEVEVRSFLKKEQYDRLLHFFKKEATLESVDDQETHYFECESDVRIQKNPTYAKIWMKGGQMHDEHRKETEIKVAADDFPKMVEVFAALAPTKVKWFRNRHTFLWGDINVMLDHTKGYGYIIELEKMASEQTKVETLGYLKQKLSALDVALTPKEEFTKAYEHYVKNWERLIT